MNNKRIFKACEIDCNKDGWIVDLSENNVTNPDCFWYFKTKKECERFLKLISDGWKVNATYNIV